MPCFFLSTIRLPHCRSAALIIMWGGNPQSTATADFNRDGKLDVAAANYGTGVVSILLGNGDGTFQSSNDYAAGANAQIPIVADFNGDGKLDLAIVT